jgi:hypothetical protein
VSVTGIVKRLVVAMLFVLSLAAGGAAGLSWRLSQGPLSLAPLQPMLERLAARGTPFAVRFQAPALAWSGERGAVALTVRDLELRSRTGQLVLAAPLAGIRVDAAALLLEQALVPVELAVDLPGMELVRTGTRRLELRFAGRLANLPLLEVAGGGGIGSLLAGAPEAGDPRLGRLRSIRVSAPLLRLEDAPRGRAFAARTAELRLERNKAGWRAVLAAAVGNGTDSGRAELSLAAGDEPGLQRVALTLDGMPARTLAELAPALPAGTLEGRLSGRVEAGLTLPDLEPRPGRFRLTGEDLALRWPEMFADTLVLEQAALAGEIAPNWQEAVIREAELASGPSRLAATGTLTLVGTGLRLDAAIEAEGLDAAQVARFWPLRKAARARAWFAAHVGGGWAGQARLGLTAPLPWADGGEPAEASLAFGFGEARVAWLDGSPPAEDVAGEALLTSTRLDFTLRHGRIGEIRLERGSLAILDIAVPEVPPRLDAELELAGPVRSALEVLNTGRLRLPVRAGIDPARTSGRVAGRLGLRLPLQRGLTPGDIAFDLDTRLREAGLADAFRGRAAGDGELTLRGDQAALRAQGTLQLEGMPVRLDWQERLTPGSPWRRQVGVWGELDAGAVGRLDLPWPGFLAGTVPMDVTVTVPWRGPRQIGFAFDLTPATLDLPALELAKPANVAGKLAGTALQPEPDRFDVERFAITLPGLALEAAAGIRLDPPAWRRLEIERLQLGGSDLSAQLVRQDDGTVSGLVQAGFLDLRRWRERLGRDEGGMLRLPPLDLGISAAELHLAEVPLRAVAGRLERGPGAWRTIRFGGRLAGGAEAGLDYRGDESGGEVHLHAGDGGRLLEAMGLRQTRIQGGQLRLDAGISLASGRVPGELSIDGFTLAESPLVARLLSLASFKGIANALSGEGIPVDRLVVPFVWSGRRIEIEDARLRGSEIGARADGAVDLAARTLALDGTIAPAYGLNWALGQVPIVGQIMRGQEADAALAATFSVRGALEAPEITVNPLSALVPGIIRDLFRDLGTDAPAAPLERDRQ